MEHCRATDSQTGTSCIGDINQYFPASFDMIPMIHQDTSGSEIQCFESYLRKGAIFKSKLIIIINNKKDFLKPKRPTSKPVTDALYKIEIV